MVGVFYSNVSDEVRVQIKAYTWNETLLVLETTAN